MFWIITSDVNAQAWLQTCITGLHAKEGTRLEADHNLQHFLVKTTYVQHIQTAQQGPLTPSLCHVRSSGLGKAVRLQSWWAALDGTTWSILPTELRVAHGELLACC